MIIKIVGVIALVIAGVVVYALFQPENYSISRSTVIQAPPEAIFPHLDNMKKMNAWNPWSNLDPQAKMTYSGPEAGAGASYEWDGNKDVGAGKATILQSTPNTSVIMELDYKRPFEGQSQVEYLLKPTGSETEMTWTVRGKSHFVMRMICLFVSMDKMMGSQLDKGLAQLKTFVETPAK